MKEMEKLGFESRKHYIRRYDLIEHGMPFYDGFIAGFLKAREMAAQKAHDYGYTLAYDSKHQPWAPEASLWLRTQNLEIEKQVKNLGESEVPRESKPPEDQL